MTDTPPGGFDVTKLLRPDLQAMPGYLAIEPIDELARRLQIAPEQVVKLDGNENPYGPSPKALEALAACRFYHIYPDPLQRQARAALAAYLGVSAEHIILGAGSDEVMDMVLRAFVRPGDGVINCPPTFGMYPFLTRVGGGRVFDVPRRDDFSLDLPAIEVAAQQAKVIFIASPNNPSGNVLSRRELDALLALELAVVIDEAYVEFAGESVVGLVPSRGNLFVLRTFSKWAGLAGLRVGYGIVPAAVTETLMKIKQPYNLNVAAQVAMLASLTDADLLKERVRALLAERERLFAALAAVPFVAPWPSQANFILCRVKAGSAAAVHERLRDRGIMVRCYPDSPRLEGCIRISVGLPEHTEALLRALKEIGGTLGN
ncbi:MAG: histidinol-phosphate transaminase [Dehalococcoidia bacterium]|jgi:histidinol-phosphate aminotransferase